MISKLEYLVWLNFRIELFTFEIEWIKYLLSEFGFMISCFFIELIIKVVDFQNYFTDKFKCPHHQTPPLLPLYGQKMFCRHFYLHKFLINCIYSDFLSRVKRMARIPWYSYLHFQIFKHWNISIIITGFLALIWSVLDFMK